MNLKYSTIFCTALLVFSDIAIVHAAPSVTAKENLARLVATKQCPGCYLSGLNFNRMDLSQANLEGADLSMSTFYLTNLSNANLKNTIMNGAVFGGADLGDADLTGADLRGVSLDSAYLGGAKMTGEIITTKPFEDIGVVEIEKKVYVENQSIPKKSPRQNEVNVSKRRGFSETPPVIVVATAKTEKVHQTAGVKQDVVHGRVMTSSLPATIVPDAPLAKTSRKVERAIVSAKAEAKMKVISVPEKKAAISKERRVNFEKFMETNSCYGCDLSDLDLAGKNLEDADLEKANLTGCNLEEADLEGANLKGAILVRANLTGANLKNADLYKANLEGADLTGAKQKNVSFDGALVDGAIGLDMPLMLHRQ